MFRSGLQTDIFGNSASNFAEWVTTSRRRCLSLRKTLARLTSANGCTASVGWQTPDAAAANLGETVESFEGRRARNKAKHGNGNGMGTPVAMQAQQFGQWQTPKAPGGGDTSRSGSRIDELLLGAGQAKNWPSARAEDSERAGNHPRATDSLNGAVKNWPTANASDDRNTSGGKGPEDNPTLRTAARTWATPNVPNRGPEQRESKAARGSGGVDVQTRAASFAAPCSHPDATTTDDGLSLLLSVWTRPKCPRLSPAFQWWLMGWPHPICFASAATGLSRSQRLLLFTNWRAQFRAELNRVLDCLEGARNAEETAET